MTNEYEVSYFAAAAWAHQHHYSCISFLSEDCEASKNIHIYFLLFIQPAITLTTLLMENNLVEENYNLLQAALDWLLNPSHSHCYPADARLDWYMESLKRRSKFSSLLPVPEYYYGLNVDMFILWKEWKISYFCELKWHVALLSFHKPSLSFEMERKIWRCLANRHRCHSCNLVQTIMAGHIDLNIDTIDTNGSVGIRSVIASLDPYLCLVSLPYVQQMTQISSEVMPASMQELKCQISRACISIWRDSHREENNS